MRMRAGTAAITLVSSAAAALTLTSLGGSGLAAPAPTSTIEPAPATDVTTSPIEPAPATDVTTTTSTVPDTTTSAPESETTTTSVPDSTTTPTTTPTTSEPEPAPPSTVPAPPPTIPTADLFFRTVSRESEDRYPFDPRKTEVIEIVNAGPSTATDVVVDLAGIVRDVTSDDFTCRIDRCEIAELARGAGGAITIRHVDYGCGYGGYQLEISSSVNDPEPINNRSLVLPCTGGTSFVVSNSSPAAGERFVVNFLCPPGELMTLSLDGSNYETSALATHEAIFELVAPSTAGTHSIIYDGCDNGSFSIRVTGGQDAPATESPTESAQEIVVTGSDSSRSIALLAGTLVALGLALLRVARSPRVAPVVSVEPGRTER